MLINHPPVNLSMDELPSKGDLIQAYPLIKDPDKQSPTARNKNHDTHLENGDYRSLHTYATATLNTDDLTAILATEGYLTPLSERKLGGHTPTDLALEEEYCLKTKTGKGRSWMWQWRQDLMASLIGAYDVTPLKDSLYSYLRYYFYYHDFAYRFTDAERKSIAVAAVHQELEELGKKVVIWGFTRKTTDDQNFTRINSWAKHAQRTGFLRDHRLVLKITNPYATPN